MFAVSKPNDSFELKKKRIKIHRRKSLKKFIAIENASIN